MTPEMLGLVLLGVLIFAIFVGFPIAFTLIILAIIFGYIGMGPVVFDLMTLQTMGFMQEEVLAAVPLFVYMGYVLERAGLMIRLFRAFQLIMGPVKGSLYLVVLLTATIFAAATGIIGASVTVIGLLAAPVMLRAKYDVRMSAGVITAGGTLGILIPPSVMLVLMGPVMGVSVVRLYSAAIVPGLILSGIYITFCMIRSYLNPKLGPPLPVEERAVSAAEVARELLVGIVPASLLIFATLGTILFGLATPTEAAAMGAFGALVLGFAYRQLDAKKLKESAFLTLETSGMILFLGVAANVYASVFSRLGTGTWITQTMLSLPLPAGGMILLLMGLIFILGWPLEWPAIVLIFLPILLPVVESLNVDLVWFGILVAVNLQTAFLSPPVAMAAYYLKGVVPSYDLKDIYVGMFQFMLLQVIGLAIVFFFPEVALWLPRVLSGK
ncbi:MAG: TRAP transporter large permease [Chloroflexota bacterium]